MEEGSPPSHQDVIEGRFESRTVDPEMPPLEAVLDVDPSNESSEPQYELEPRGPNVFTNNAASGRGRGLLNVNPFPPRGRGQIRRPFMGRGRSTDN